MDSGSSYRVYSSSDLHTIPPTAIQKRSHIADDGVGWSGFAFLVAVGVAIGGASLAAMHVVKPDAQPRTTAAVSAPVAEPVPAPVVVADPPAPAQTASEPAAPPAETAKVATAKKPVTGKSRRTKAKSDPVPANPYDANHVDRGMPPQI
jgi:hypothetical protein